MTVFQIYAQQEPSRIEKKSFSGVEEVRFEHSYGNITVIESESQQVELEIRYFDEEDAKPVCEISAETILKIKTVMPENMDDSGGWNIFGIKINYSKNNRGQKNHKRGGIDYVIAVPKNVAMNVNLRYGHLVMGDFYGDFTGDVNYGSLTANTFHKSPVNISSKYSNVKLEQVDVLNISIDYANLEAETINTLKLQAKYGKYQVKETKNVDADCSYGNIGIETIETLKLQVKYGNHKFGKIDKADINCSYGNIGIETIETLKLQAKYGNYRIGKSEKMEINGSYGHINIDSVEEFDAELLYTPTNIEYLKDKLNMRCQYSNVKVSNSSKQLETVKFSGKYSGFTIGLDADLSATLNVDLKYGNLSMDDKHGAKYSFSEKDYQATVKKGIIGSETPTAKIEISNSYANVSIR
jgi:hypothetical protein